MKRKGLKLYTLALSTALLATGCSNPSQTGSTTAAPETTTAAKPEATGATQPATTPASVPATQSTEPATTATPETERPVINDELFYETAKDEHMPVFCVGTGFIGSDKWVRFSERIETTTAVTDGMFLEIHADIKYMSGGIVGYEHEPVIEKLYSETPVDYDTAISKYKIPELAENKACYIHYYSVNSLNYIIVRDASEYRVYCSNKYLGAIPLNTHAPATTPTAEEMDLFLNSIRVQVNENTTINASELTAGHKDDSITTVPIAEAFTESFQNFTSALSKTVFENAKPGENFLVSPLSVMTCMSMAANGADNETLVQIEKVMGGNLSMVDIAPSLYSYYAFLAEKAPEVFSTANSIWINEQNSTADQIREDFLKKNISYFDAAVYRTVFDTAALSDINNWCSQKTNNMIPKLMDELSPQSAMILINALCFESYWQKPFEANDTKQGTFTDANGKELLVDRMSGSADYYLEGDDYTGFMKSYRDVPFAFAALLPKEDETAEDLLKSFSGSDYASLLTDRQAEDVYVVIPKFKFDADYLLNNSLQQLGIKDAFVSGLADFSGMTGDKSLYISKVIHKTHIELSEQGTRAAAVTAIEMRKLAFAMSEHKVVLDRPFVFMILDTQYGLPIFVGVTQTV